MHRKLLGLVGVVLLCLPVPPPARAGNTWRTRAVLDVTATGLMEAVIPPQLISSKVPGRMDFNLTGPDGRPRAFELYWRDPVGPTRFVLEPERVELDPSEGFIWEAALREKMMVRRLFVDLADRVTIGKIDVYGRSGGKWSLLTRNAAVIAGAAGHRAAIDVTPCACDRLRLLFTGYDRRARQTLTPIKSVTVEGSRLGRDYAVRTLDLAFQASESQGQRVIEAVLPGAGLWIDDLDLKTEAQFAGGWQLGRERVSGGTRQFDTMARGRIDHVDRMPRDLHLKIGRAWPGRSLVLKLAPGQGYIGAATRLKITVRLPRLVFVAEKPGRYTALTGTGTGSAVRDDSVDRHREPQARLVFSDPETNPQWHLATLVEKYRLMGGPFSDDGYTWRAPIDIPAPGYYRLALSLQAGLAYRDGGVRIVREDRQVPYVAGRLEDRTLDLDTAADYDAPSNTSTWTVRLPQASACWKALTFYAGGIFKRTVEFQKSKAGHRSWQTLRRMTWENRGGRQTALRLSLGDLPDDVQTIRLVMAHGDNQPIAITKITADYTVPTYYFLARAAGDYTIYGGNPDAGTPRYDLSLVQDELFSTLPVEVRMGDLESLGHCNWRSRIGDAFKERGWGLYAVLGLVTLMLIVVIARLFPKSGDSR
jgi:hypothetical protein